MKKIHLIQSITVTMSWLLGYAGSFAPRIPNHGGVGLKCFIFPKENLVYAMTGHQNIWMVFVFVTLCIVFASCFTTNKSTFSEITVLGLPSQSGR